MSICKSTSVRCFTSRKKTVAVAKSSVTPMVKTVRMSIATGTKSSAGVKGCFNAAINRTNCTSESAKSPRFDPTTESGKTACGRRTLRIKSWLERIEFNPCINDVLKKSQGNNAESRQMEKLGKLEGMMVVKTTV